jgi:hypothetical protein
VPDVIYGYRWWRISNNFYLSAINRTIWRVGENQARCLKNNSHAAPAPNCTCGIYARYFPSDIDDIVGYYSRYRDYVKGVMAAYGNLELGTRGFRAEKAKIVAITYSEDVKNIELHERVAYNYKALLFKSFANLIEIYPPSDVSELIFDDANSAECIHYKHNLAFANSMVARRTDPYVSYMDTAWHGRMAAIYSQPIYEKSYILKITGA